MMPIVRRSRRARPRSLHGKSMLLRNWVSYHFSCSLTYSSMFRMLGIMPIACCGDARLFSSGGSFRNVTWGFEKARCVMPSALWGQGPSLKAKMRALGFRSEALGAERKAKKAATYGDRVQSSIGVGKP